MLFLIDFKLTDIVGFKISDTLILMNYSKILLPSRPQVDTIVALFILKRFGEEKFPGISTATYEFGALMPEGSEEELNKEGIFLIDIGNGQFDHHNKSPQTTAVNLISDYLGQKDNPALLRLKQFVERDDFYGKGIISTDQIDRAFGLPGLIGCLNKKYFTDPSKVVDIIHPLIEAYYEEEEKRAIGMPKELAEKLENGKATAIEFRQKGRKMKCIFIETDNPSMAGFLRSKLGGEFDVTAIKLSSGHTNVLTQQRRNVDLRSLAVLIRMQEAEAKGTPLSGDPEAFAIPGKIKEVSNWYYDIATNSLLNGGPNPGSIQATAIPAFEFVKLLELGLSEKLWTPAS